MVVQKRCETTPIFRSSVYQTQRGWNLAPAGFTDYIVHYTSGKYGIYDTKGGDTVKSEDTKRKAEALQDYLASKLKNANFRGGMVDSRSNNTFFLNTSDVYDHTDKTQWSEFAPF